MKSILKIQLLIAFVFVLSTLHVAGQEILNPQVIANFTKNDLIKLLKPDEEKELENQLKVKKKAEKLEKKADKYFDKFKKYDEKAKKKERFAKKAEKFYNKGVAELREASEMYESIAKVRFDLYSKYLNEEKTKCFEQNLDIAKHFVDSAILIYDDANALRSKIKSLKLKEEIDEAMKLADKLEQKSLDVVLTAYGIYNTQEIIELKKEKEKEVIEEVPDVETEETKEVVTVPDDVVLFQIQLIALKSKPLTVEEMKEMFNIDEHVYRAEENGFYKYRIGRFDSYEEAMLYRDNLNIADAFIVGYINGEKVPLAQALELWEQQNR